MQTPHRLHGEQAALHLLQLRLTSSTLTHRASIECHFLPPSSSAAVIRRCARRTNKRPLLWQGNRQALLCAPAVCGVGAPTLLPSPAPEVWAPLPEGVCKVSQNSRRSVPVGACVNKLRSFFFRQDKHRSVSSVLERKQIVGRLFLGCGFKGPLTAAELKFLLGSNRCSCPIPCSGFNCLLHSYVAHTWQAPFAALWLWSEDGLEAGKSTRRAKNGNLDRYKTTCFSYR